MGSGAFVVCVGRVMWRCGEVVWAMGSGCGEGFGWRVLDKWRSQKMDFGWNAYIVRRCVAVGLLFS